jgi:RNA polymerase sigma factor (sigma-70 family)
VPAFAMASARNVAMDWIRRKRVVPLDTVEDLGALSVIDDSVDLEAMVHSHQQLVRLAGSVAQLPERCREVFTLRHVYGLSQKEIAQRLKTSEGAVEQLLVRGMRRCLELMQAPTGGGDFKNTGRRVGLVGRWRRLLTKEEGQG